MAITTTKRPSELVALLCDENHFRWEGKNLRFVPLRLTKTDRPGHLTPPSTSSLGLLRQALEGRFVRLSGGDRKTHFAGA
jgi:hypothetical protein